MSNHRFGVAALALALMAGPATAQSTSPDTTAPAAKSAPETVKPPVAGANSFTETQARDRISAAGFVDVKQLRKDDQGVWRGMARKGETQVNVALDFRGNVVQE